MEYSSQVYTLSTKFTTDYPNATYPELMYKQGRPYTCLLIEYHEDYFICVPFRSNIHHTNAYIFTTTARSRRSRSGLDYTKIAIISDLDYIDSSITAIVDNDEYAEMMKNLTQITQEVIDYVDTYISHANGTKPLHPRAYARTYGFSTLPYFHDILGIPTQ